MRREPLLLLLVAIGLLALSGIAPRDRVSWWMEVASVLVGIPLLAGTYRRFPLTPLIFRLLFAHRVILMVGGHYTDARVPLGRAHDRELEARA